MLSIKNILTFQALWFAMMFVLIHLRRRQRVQNRRDIAESLEDARIYAESLNQVRQLCQIVSLFEN